MIHGLVLLIAIFGPLIILWVAYAILYERFRESRVRKYLKAQERILNWKEVESHLSTGNGTLILEQVNKSPVRIWWTTDDIIAIAPAPSLNWDNFDYGYITGKTENPFVLWCFPNYVSVKAGKAFFTHFTGQLPPGPAESAFFQDLYPKAKVVQTVLINKNR